MLNDRKTPSCVLLLHQVDSPMVANCFLEAWLIATSNMIWLPNEKSELHFKIFKHYLNKTSTTKLSSISCLIWSPHGNIWQHSKVPRPEPGPDLQGLPHILAGVPGLCRVASCDDGYESRTRVKRNNVVNKDVSRCFNWHKKMSEFQTKSPAARLLL